ncbi:CCCH zinc finger and SMR domain protein [Rasamsonia emersonii CBS 393.64]|uniref:CCCH zinc finger and SMR domain protein n=1 Tax=Rasamsonia emersonii (strain ATCC 16479 / CBS 393.64 / IMI 116815) TaxID=1408163 RepID=A0A0F4YP48_RASE3|nr:CCCH zinc finger and SMR domain protein [Rasamsonia emersonii CBS 393.64]KKA20024.1 CCCH zinc finger and SMR domain protein [Rasamsonia emersonii CBS 393.64]
MVSEELFEACLPVLRDSSLDEEEQIEKVEELLREKASLSGSALENAVLDILWRKRNDGQPDASPPPSRHTVIRRSSPAPWQIARSATPLSSPSQTGTSPAGPSGLHHPRAGLPRAPLSSTASPFTSPRPSPRLAFAQPIPHSPSLNAYEFSDQSQSSDFYGDFGSESNVDWLVGDDATSVTSSVGGLSASAPEFVPDMSPHDILRSVLGDQKSNEEIDAALEANSYDLGATIAALSENKNKNNSGQKSEEGKILVGKSITMEQIRPGTPATTRSPVVCKYWLSTGQCLRADCRFSHDLTSHVCNCPFSHDPASLIGNMNLNDGNNNQGSSNQQQGFQLENNYEAFPALQPTSGSGDQWSSPYLRKYPNQALITNPAVGNPPLGVGRRNGGSRPHSRPTSRHQQREANPSPLSVDDPEAFPSLSAAKGSGKKHHGKRGGHNNKENVPIRWPMWYAWRLLPPRVKASRPRMGKKMPKRESSALQPKRFRHPNTSHGWKLGPGPISSTSNTGQTPSAMVLSGTSSCKDLSSAAQAWNRNDARAAKALSLRGQAENEAMRKCHREAARHLYEERNKHLASNGLDEATEELYVDLHGLHPEEAVEYLEKILRKHSKEDRILYAITGTGHHSKNGKDKVGKAVKAWLNEWKYVFREFSVPGERGGYVGGVLGIDPTSYDKSMAKKLAQEGDGEAAGTSNNQPASTGKIQVLKREDVEAAKEQ